MSVLHRNRNVPAEPPVTAPEHGLAAATAGGGLGRAPRTRTGAAWVRYLYRRCYFGGAYRLHAAEHRKRCHHLPVDARQRAACAGPYSPPVLALPSPPWRSVRPASANCVAPRADNNKARAALNRVRRNPSRAPSAAQLADAFVVGGWEGLDMSALDGDLGVRAIDATTAA
jgi:hypothetical protein